MKTKQKKIIVAAIVSVLVVGLAVGVILGKKKEPEKVVEKQSKPKPELVIEIPQEPEPTPIPENENILTGIGDLTQEAIGKRPVAVMVNNVEPALPQYGISKADVIFEIPVEGSLTRFMALYGDYTQVPKICPIRSCRYYFPAIAKGFDAYYIHWGSDQSILGYVNSLGIDRYDGMRNPYGMFGRDNARRSAGYALEHTGYFDGTKLPSVLKKEGTRTELRKNKRGTAFRFCGMDEIITPGGKVCDYVAINFGASGSSFQYNAEKQVYVKKMNGHAHKDAKTGENLKFTNVFILETSISIRDAKGHKQIDWAGGKNAKGYYISNGKREKIHWSKKNGNEGAYLKFYDKNGQELTINRGKSYIAYVSPGGVAFEK